MKTDVKVVFLYPAVYSIREYRRFGIEILKNAFREVEMWAVVSKEVKDVTIADEYKEKEVRKLVGLREFKAAVRKNQNAVYIDMLGGRGVAERMYMSKLGCRRFEIYCNPIPMPEKKQENKPAQEKNILFRGYELVKRVGIKTIIRAERKENLRRKCRRHAERYVPEMQFLSTQEDLRKIPVELRAKDIEYIHTLDYDLILQPENLDLKALPHKYILFVDSGYANQHWDDLLVADWNNPIRNKERQYLSELNSLFVKVEEKYGCPVVIAEHPHATYHENDFQGRKRYRYATSDLIRGAELVIGHTTTAVNFVVCYHKPYLLIYDDMIYAAFWERNFEPYMKVLGLGACNLSDQEEDPCSYIQYIDDEHEKLYRERFIKRKGTEEKLFFAVVADRIKRKLG